MKQVAFNIFRTQQSHKGEALAKLLRFHYGCGVGKLPIHVWFSSFIFEPQTDSLSVSVSIGVWPCLLRNAGEAHEV